MESELKYPEGKVIQNGDMFEFKDGNVGFVFYDERVGCWNVKFRAKSNQAFEQPLESIHRWIKSFII
ncbi:hypothetical protein [Paenibacillus psychroresistens]|uniref:hypothetical protein n=1 Tax=Paenibacillus psychroresistens TaxID=1778678 RepID=UPI001D04AD86|nr:hypothetical protein [Paenibacillus psychroresistens]